MAVAKQSWISSMQSSLTLAYIALFSLFIVSSFKWSGPEVWFDQPTQLNGEKVRDRATPERKTNFHHPKSIITTSENSARWRLAGVCISIICFLWGVVCVVAFVLFFRGAAFALFWGVVSGAAFGFFYFMVGAVIFFLGFCRRCRGDWWAKTVFRPVRSKGLPFGRTAVLQEQPAMIAEKTWLIAALKALRNRVRCKCRGL